MDRPVEADLYSGIASDPNAMRGALANSLAFSGSDKDEAMHDAAHTGAPFSHISAPGSMPGSPTRMDKIAEAAAAAVLRKQSQVPLVGGVVRSAAWDTSGDICVTIFPACKAHAHAAGSCCSQVCHLVRITALI